MKPQAKIIMCNGEAHQPGIDYDHCMICLPFWGKIPTCPAHLTKLNQTGYCKGCKMYYDTTVPFVMIVSEIWGND
jgi:hypothetical protein